MTLCSSRIGADPSAVRASVRSIINRRTRLNSDIGPGRGVLGREDREVRREALAYQPRI